MRADLIFRATFTFIRHTAVATQDPVNGTQYTWQEDGRYDAMVIPTTNGVQLMTREPLGFYDKVTDIADRSGQVLYGVNLFVHGVDAQVDPFGRVIGYKNTLRTREPRDRDADLVNAINNLEA